MLAINRNPLQTVIGQNEPTQDFLGIANVLLDARGSSAKGDHITVVAIWAVMGSAPHEHHAKLTGHQLAGRQ